MSVSVCLLEDGWRWPGRGMGMDRLGGGTAVYKEGERTGGGDPLASASPRLPNSEQLVLMRAVSEVDQLPLSKWVKITPSL